MLETSSFRTSLSRHCASCSKCSSTYHLSVFSLHWRYLFVLNWCLHAIHSRNVIAESGILSCDVLYSVICMYCTFLLLFCCDKRCCSFTVHNMNTASEGGLRPCQAAFLAAFSAGLLHHVSDVNKVLLLLINEYKYRKTGNHKEIQTRKQNRR